MWPLYLGTTQTHPIHQNKIQMSYLGKHWIQEGISLQKMDHVKKMQPQNTLPKMSMVLLFCWETMEATWSLNGHLYGECSCDEQIGHGSQRFPLAFALTLVARVEQQSPEKVVFPLPHLFLPPEPYVMWLTSMLVVWGDVAAAIWNALL